MLSLDRLQSLLDQFPRLTIGLVGDLFLDRYLEIEPGVREMSIETGLEAYQVTRVRNAPGALGTVMNNLAALGVGNLVAASVIGDDGHGYDLLNALESLPVDVEPIVCVPDRLTPTYTKPMQPVERAEASSRELNRIDVRTRAPLSAGTHQKLASALREMFQRVDGLIVLDQIVEPNWGVVDARLRNVLAELAKENPTKLIYIDSRAFLGEFAFGMLKGNRSEYLRAASLQHAEADLPAALEKFAQRNLQPMFCTLGDEGILVARPNAKTERVAGFPVPPPVDIVGAGDAASSGIVASLLVGATETESATVGNLVASITVQQLGTTGTARPEEVIARYRETKA